MGHSRHGHQDLAAVRLLVGTATARRGLGGQGAASEQVAKAEGGPLHADTAPAGLLARALRFAPAPGRAAGLTESVAELTRGATCVETCQKQAGQLVSGRGGAAEPGAASQGLGVGCLWGCLTPSGSLFLL